ncbi:hypothetical protein SAY87_029126 [Trapa incisa]|uniref:Protein BIG GRAIN 1-like A n=1 Tax=Trapa incisa TaxID=236973 RepID=A0AAN7QPX2_9MYRT|nr:hypothetical protein SAY87_029126 [Trapa incisa]
MRDHHHQNCPSFSSTLLDAIYRSIDDEGIRDQPHQQHRQQQFHCQLDHDILKGKSGADNGHRVEAHGIKKSWMDKRHNEMATARRSSVAYTGRSLRSFCNSRSSSSETSSNRGGWFSPSDSDNYSSRSESKSRAPSACYSMNNLKPIRTSISGDRLARPPRTISLHGENYDLQVHQVVRPNNLHKQGGGGAVKAKSKALKIFEDFKRMNGSNKKHPVSPGAKLASFLNALFSAKKAKYLSAYKAHFSGGRVPESGYSSTCSSASSSSSSRSCMSNTPSSRGKLTGTGTETSVRFCPVNVTVGKDLWAAGGHKSRHLVDRHQQSNSMKKYPRTQENQELFHVSEDQEDKEEDDGVSCESSDLFELENLSRIGDRWWV